MNKLRSPQHYCRMYVGCVPVCVHCVSRGLRGVHMYACAVSPPLVCSGIRHIYIYIYMRAGISYRRSFWAAWRKRTLSLCVCSMLCVNVVYDRSLHIYIYVFFFFLMHASSNMTVCITINIFWLFFFIALFSMEHFVVIVLRLSYIYYYYIYSRRFVSCSMFQPDEPTHWSWRKKSNTDPNL